MKHPRKLSQETIEQTKRIDRLEVRTERTQRRSLTLLEKLERIRRENHIAASLPLSRKDR